VPVDLAPRSLPVGVVDVLRGPAALPAGWDRPPASAGAERGVRLDGGWLFSLCPSPAPRSAGSRSWLAPSRWR
jgi:hypothetical protein